MIFDTVTEIVKIMIILSQLMQYLSKAFKLAVIFSNDSNCVKK